jgi:hypothetical protein
MLPNRILFQSNYLKERIKIGNKTGQMGDNVTLELAKSKLTLTSSVPFSKRQVVSICCY